MMHSIIHSTLPCLSVQIWWPPQTLIMQCWTIVIACTISVPWADPSRIDLLQIVEDIHLWGRANVIWNSVMNFHGFIFVHHMSILCTYYCVAHHFILISVQWRSQHMKYDWWPCPRAIKQINERIWPQIILQTQTYIIIYSGAHGIWSRMEGRKQVRWPSENRLDCLSGWRCKRQSVGMNDCAYTYMYIYRRHIFTPCGICMWIHPDWCRHSICPLRTPHTTTGCMPVFEWVCVHVFIPPGLCSIAVQIYSYARYQFWRIFRIQFFFFCILQMQIRTHRHSLLWT